MVGEWGARVVKNKTPVIFSHQNTTQSKSKSRTQKVVAVIPQNSTTTSVLYTGNRGTGSSQFSLDSFMCTLFVTDITSVY